MVTLGLIVGFVLALANLHLLVVLLMHPNDPLRCQEKKERDSRTVRRQLAIG
jgi:archaellum biogenesis protein FlaJ (TadC family)